MWQGLTIALREGIESFLVVALTVLYLVRTDRRRLLPAVWWGVGVSVAACAGAGYILSKALSQSLWEGVLALASAVMVGSFLIYMKKMASRLKADIESRVESAASRGSAAAGFWGIFLFTVFMVTREGMETALLIDSALFQLKSARVFLGLVIGLLAAVAIGFLWIRMGRKINFGAILNISSVFLALFLVQLLIAGFHELAEAGVWPNSQVLHNATESIGPDGRYGQWLAYALAAVPTLWIFISWLRHRSAPPADTAGSNT
ncbi:MAG: FTR1 family iron permease [Thermoanaerobaculia bacterium]